MAESTQEPRGPDPRDRDPSSGMAAAPGAAPLHSPRGTPGEGSDSDSDTPDSVVLPSEEEEEEGHQWQVGDTCSSIWAGDGRLYRARVRALDRATGMCLVEFNGSGHTEQRALAHLLPANAATSAVPPSWELPPGARRRRRRRRRRRKKDEQAPGSPWPPEEEEEDEEEADALAAMLTAWYLSGYHTGFYMALQESQAEAAEPPPRPGYRQKQPPCY